MTSASHRTTSRTRLALVAGAVVLATAAAACSDDGATVRDLGASSGSGSASGSASASASGSGSASASASTPADCEPVNVELEASADTVVTMTVSDFAFDQEVYEVEAGTVTFAVTNAGSAYHEVAFLPGGGDVPHDGGAPDEGALEAAGAFELEAFAPGTTCNATFELEPGTYTLFCIVSIDDGRTHYDEGMRATLVVS